MAVGDLIDVVEASYRVELDEATWLKGVFDAALPHLDCGLGGSAFSYDASDIHHLRVGHFLSDSANQAALIAAIEASTPEGVHWVFRTQACQTASEGPNGTKQPAYKLFETRGFADVLFVNGVDPSGKGALFTIRLKRRTQILRTTIKAWRLVAAHMAAGYRLRTSLAQLRIKPIDRAEMILSPRGKMEHVSPELESDRRTMARALPAMKTAVRGIERARGKLRHTAPVEALSGWTALSGARWTMLDRVDSDGRRHFLACANAPQIDDLPLLTLRERQVLAFAALGHHNTLISYQLGITPSTVGVLLLRATRKLEASSRSDAIGTFRRLSAAV